MRAKPSLARSNSPGAHHCSEVPTSPRSLRCQIGLQDWRIVFGSTITQSSLFFLFLFFLI